MKIIGIVEISSITGVKYGEIEIPDIQISNGNPTKSAQAAYYQIKELQKLRAVKLRKNNTKHK